MADGRFSFSMPRAPGFDFSPIMEGARVEAAAYQAFGQAVGSGMKEMLEDKRRAMAEEKMQSLFTDLSKDEWYREEEYVPARDMFPDVYSTSIDEHGKVDEKRLAQRIALNLQRSKRVTPDEAASMAQQLMEPQKLRYLTPEGTVGLVKTTSGLSAELAKLGLDPSYMVAPIQQAMGAAAPTREDALMRARQTSERMMTPQGWTDQAKFAATVGAQQEMAHIQGEIDRLRQDEYIKGIGSNQREIAELNHRYDMLRQEQGQMFAAGEADRARAFEQMMQDRKFGQRMTEQEIGYEQARTLQREQGQQRAEAGMDQLVYEWDQRKAIAALENQASALGFKPSPSEMKALGKLGRSIEDYLGKPGSKRAKDISMSADDLPILQNNEVLIEQLRNQGATEIDEDKLRNIRIGLEMDGNGMPRAVATYNPGGGGVEGRSGTVTKAAQAILDSNPDMTNAIIARMLMGSAEVTPDDLEALTLYGPELGQGWYMAAIQMAQESMKGKPAEISDDVLGDVMNPDMNRFRVGR